jgi:hypothetical protein
MTVKISIADALVNLALDRFEPFHDPAGEAWAWEVGAHDTFLIGSSPFADRLVRDFYSWSARSRTLTNGGARVPPQAAITQAVQTLRGIARYDGAEAPVFVRIGSDPEGRIVLDLADAERRAVVISSNGWELVTSPPVRFWRPEGMGALPVPEGGGNLDELLADTLRLGDEAQLVLIEGWLLGCINPTGSKPVLMINGEQGSGKSELARALRSVCDPNASPLRAMPADERDLVIMARRSAVLGFDNVSVLTDELSDALCRLATGGGYSTRRLYTDDEEMVFRATRPIVLTAIPDVDRQPDLADRSIHIGLDAIDDADRRTEADLRETFGAAHPHILGALLDAAGCALANLSTTSLPELPRMADVALFVTAAEPALGQEQGTFLDAYRRNRDEAAESAIEGTPIGQYLVEVAREGFAGTATQLLARIRRQAGYEAPRSRGWPASPRGLAGIVRRLAPALRSSGCSVEFERIGHRHERIIRLTYLDHEGPPGVLVPIASDERTVEEVSNEVLLAMAAQNLKQDSPLAAFAALAKAKAGGNNFLAASALNGLGISAPDGGPWTAWKIAGVT